MNYINLNVGSAIESTFFSVLLTISAILVTIFIPLGITILQDGDKSGIDKFYTRSIFDYKYFLLFLGVALVPLLFWDISGSITKTLIFISWLIGSTTVLRMMYLMFRFKYEIDKENLYMVFLEKNAKSETVKAMLESKPSEAVLNRIISLIIDKLNSNNNNPVVLNQIIDLIIEKYDDLYLPNKAFSKDFFKKVLEIHFLAWDKTWDNIDNLNIYSYYSDLLDKTNVVIDRLQLDILNNQSSAYLFYRDIGGWFQARAHFSKTTEKNIHYYLESFSFYTKFFEYIPESKINYKIWHHFFPEEWFVTQKNLESKNLTTIIWFNEFNQWVQTKIDGEKKITRALNEVTANLFPDVDPITWSIILTFVYRSWSDDKRMEALIGRDRNFGFVGRVYGFWEANDNVNQKFSEAFQKSQESSIELAVLLYRNSFKEINRYIADLTRLKGKYSNEKLQYCEQILNLFQKIKSHLE